MTSAAFKWFGGFMRLLRHQGGNTLAIVAAALIPLTAMIGSGVDMSRAYMAKTRLQSACDAASLAGRRVMQNDTLTASVTAEAIRFFNYNFNQGLYDTAAFTPVVTRPSQGTVRVTASTTIPTTIMRMFGFTTLPLDVTCDASLNFVNTDIMMVLDTTGSMADDVNGNSTSATSAQKITGLRNAVMALYDELTPVQTQLEANGMRLRYGVVPYSSTVNVGNLIRQVNPAYLATQVDYETRVANYNTPTSGTPTTTVLPAVVEVFNNGQAIKSTDCAKYGRNQSFGGFSPSPTAGGGPSPSPTWSRAYSNDATAGADWGYPGAATTSGNKRSCRRRYVQTNTTYNGRYAFTNYSYRTDSIDVTQFNNPSNSVAIATGTNGSVAASGAYNPAELAQLATGVSTTTSSWGGCIMERDTTDDITSTSSMAIPSDAYDLQVDYIPDSDETRWRAFWPQVTYYRSSIYSLSPNQSTSGSPLTSYSDYMACPAPARRLYRVPNRGDLQSYVNTLDPQGNTYHDIGMLWGARMISSGGIFADSPTTYNGMPVTRHVIFMTDGLLNTTTSTYGAYGVEGMEQRVAGGNNSTLNDRHRQRFRMICNQLKSMNVSIWVVAFATTLDSALTECASNANQAFVAADSAQLVQRFREIGANIGALRLTQ